MQPPEEVLKSFIAEMDAWETRCAARSKKVDANEISYEDAKRMRIEEFKTISDRHCSIKAKMRSGSFGREYDSDIVKILEMRPKSDKLVEIETTGNPHLKTNYRFNLRLENGEWKVLERFDQNLAGEFERHSL